MDQAEIERQFRHIEVWKRGSERAPHKPLLLLYALGRAGRNNDRLMPYSEVDRALHELLKEFGPHRRSIHTEYPFWRLQHDGIWQISASTALERRGSNAEPKKSELLKHGVQGGFPPDIWAALQQDPSLALALAHIILDMNFPPSLHDDLLSATGLDGDMARVAPKHRDPQFRMRVLTAYEHCCAICGFDVRLGSIQLGLDAAHIMWHQAGGPDVLQNGLALCTLHHKLFDRGAFTLDFGQSGC